MTTTPQRPQTLGEDIANAISHGFGVAAIAAAAPFLLLAAIDHGGARAVVCASIFIATTVLLYLASTLYHALRPGRAKCLFQVFDHSAIFLLIAGTYTPFTLSTLRGGWGWSLFGVVWGLALLGIVVEAFQPKHREALALTLYLSMGWLVLVAVVPLFQVVPLGGCMLLLAGGLAYTLGTVFYVFDRLPYVHFVWHLFVLAGTACHTVAVLNYAT